MRKILGRFWPKNEEAAEEEIQMPKIRKPRSSRRKPKPKKVKLFGCRHSGTKYMTQLLRLNWGVQVPTLAHGFKHQVPNYEMTIPSVLIHKHPAAFIASVRDREWSYEKTSQELIEIWVKSNQGWLEIPNIAVVKYDDLLSDFQNTMKKIEDKLKLEREFPNFRNIHKYIGNPERKVKTQYYINKEYLKKMTEEDWDAISNIPIELIEQLGYKDSG